MKSKSIHLSLFLLVLLSLSSCQPFPGQPIASTAPTIASSPIPAATHTPVPTASGTATPTATLAILLKARRTPTYAVSPAALFLSDLQPYILPVNVYNGLRLDRVFWQPEIWIDGVHYAKGLGMHAPARGTAYVGYKVPASYTRFASLVGLAREDGNEYCETAGDARFRVYVNNEPEFDSGIVRFGPPLVVDIGVQAGDVLRLEVDHGDDNYECDHATWALARFEP